MNQFLNDSELTGRHLEVQALETTQLTEFTERCSCIPWASMNCWRSPRSTLRTNICCTQTYSEPFQCCSSSAANTTTNCSSTRSPSSSKSKFKALKTPSKSRSRTRSRSLKTWGTSWTQSNATTKDSWTATQTPSFKSPSSTRRPESWKRNLKLR